MRERERDINKKKKTFLLINTKMKLNQAIKKKEDRDWYISWV